MEIRPLLDSQTLDVETIVRCHIYPEFWVFLIYQLLPIWNNKKYIILLCKILAIIIYNRLKEELEPKMRPEQGRFWPNKSRANNINTLQIIVEQSVEFRSPLQLVFIDSHQ